MKKLERTSQRREQSLSRERIIEASIEILDDAGEAGLTFQALSKKLATGPGAIYWHVANKSDLVTAACDAIVARSMQTPAAVTSPKAIIRDLALHMFDTIDAHPWVGSALARSAGGLPILRILEPIGRQVRALGVPEAQLWAVASILLNYILGVGGQNAANGKLARDHGLDRSKVLEDASEAWSKLDPDEFSFTRSVAAQMCAHDDRVDFLVGIDLILGGIDRL